MQPPLFIGWWRETQAHANTLTPLLANFLQTIVYLGQLYAPVTLDTSRLSKYFSAGRYTWTISTWLLGQRSELVLCIILDHPVCTQVLESEMSRLCRSDDSL